MGRHKRPPSTTIRIRVETLDLLRLHRYHKHHMSDDETLRYILSFVPSPPPLPAPVVPLEPETSQERQARHIEALKARILREAAEYPL